jgi:hypothetical protein
MNFLETRIFKMGESLEAGLNPALVAKIERLGRGIVQEQGKGGRVVLYINGLTRMALI